MAAGLCAVIFDMDGVLVDSEPLHGRAWTEVLLPLGVPLADGWFVRWIGIPDTGIADHVIAAHALPTSQQDLLARKRTIFEALVPTDMRAFAGVAEALPRLAGVPLAVATSSSRDDAERSLTAAALLDFFPIMVCAEDVPRHKPDPLPYLRAAELLGVPPEACVVVEDSPAGVASALGAGCHVIAVPTGHPAERLAQAAIVVPTMAEAMRFVHEALAV